MIAKPDHAEARYLVIELLSGDCAIHDEAGVFRRRGGPGLMQLIIVDLTAIEAKFELQAPQQDEFVLAEVAAMAQEKVNTVRSWVAGGIMDASVLGARGRRKAMVFDRVDAMTAILLASLKRKSGVPLKTLRNVAKALREKTRTTVSPKG